MIAAVDKTNNKIKVKLANLLQEFSSSEYVHSNVVTIAGTANGILNSTSLPFQANTMSANVTTAIALVSATTPSSFIAEKNAFTQNPIVRLYSIYYPGEWYPPNANGNPTGQGAGYAWPAIFPIRFAEIVGDLAEDISYKVTYDGISYTPYPVNVSGLEQASDGKINELTLSVFNTDNLISYLVENPYLAGVNTSNSVSAYVNGELVYGIDPATVIGSTSYDANIVAYYGMANAAFDKSRTTTVNGTWQQQKMDTRDLLGAAVEIKTTFANFLDYWPEYGKVTNSTNTNISVTNTLPYRVGDVVRLPANTYSAATITAIDSDASITLNKPITRYKYFGGTDSNIHGLTFKPDGSKAYIAGLSNDKVYEFNISNAWDITSASYLQNVSIASQEANVTHVEISSSGNYLYVVGTTNDNIYRYTLSTAWNVTTASLTETFNVAPYETDTQGFAFDSTGTNVYIVGSTYDKVHQFNLATAWSLATATYKQNVSISAQDTTSTDLHFKDDGTKFYILGSTSDKIHQYALSTAWDISTTTYVGNTYVGMLEDTPTFVAFNSIGDTLYFGGTTTDNVYQVALPSRWDVTSVTYSLPTDSKLVINNPQSDTSSYLIDNYKIDQLESLGENVATFGLVSWLQYFKIVTPKRKYYKNTCQWKYKGDECQYPGAGGLTIPGTTLKSPSYSIDVNNQPSGTLAPSLINMNSWTVGTGAVGNYVLNGDGNSRIVDSTPYGDLGVLWDISNQDAASDADGGWNYSPLDVPIDPTKTYRYSVWVRRKTIGNGQTYMGPDVFGTTNTLNRSNNASNTNPYFIGDNWWGVANQWYLVVGHIWSYGSGSGAKHVDTAIYSKDGTKAALVPSDFIWSTASGITSGMRAFLYYSTDTTTNQQFYSPRIDNMSTNAPTIANLLSLSPSQLAARLGQDVCAKSLAACTVRNNSIHFGGFAGVGRTVPQM